MQGCLNCYKASHQSPGAGPSCVTRFVLWISAFCRCLLCLKVFLCSGTGTAKISMTATHTPLCQNGLIQTKKLAGLCLSAHFLYQQITPIVPWSAKGDGCIRDEHVKGSPSNCAQPRTGANFSPVPLWRRGRSRYSCSHVSHASLLSTTRNSREAGQHNKEMQPRYLFICQGVSKDAAVGLIKMCFNPLNVF